MSEVQIYLFAPRRVGLRRWVRSVKIEEATFNADGRSYTAGPLILDADVECDRNTPNQCLIIRGKVESAL